MLSLNHSTAENITLTSANKLFIRKGIKVKIRFQENLKKAFNSSVSAIDITNSANAARNINKWIENNTGCKIKDVITENMITKRTMMVLINAIYFRAKWKTPFNQNKTKMEDFFMSGNKTAKVPTMHLTTNVLLVELDKFKTKVIRLPYEGDKVVMDILLPGDRDGLNDMEAKISSVDVALLIKEKAVNTTVRIQLPKFSFGTETKLKKPLEKLGIKAIFQSGGLEGMSTDNLLVNQIIQKAVIKVDEEGTEAAAVTVATIVAVSARPPPTNFIADHPFLFLLKEASTGLIIFRGKVNNPLSKS